MEFLEAGEEVLVLVQGVKLFRGAELSSFGYLLFVYVGLRTLPYHLLADHAFLQQPRHDAGIAILEEVRVLLGSRRERQLVCFSGRTVCIDEEIP